MSTDVAPRWIHRALTALSLLFSCNVSPARQVSSPSPASFANAPRPTILAHRGGGGERPEETLDALRYAAAQGPVVLDMDVHLSSDGVPVLLHDDDLDRTTEGHGPVRARTVAELQTLDAAYCFSPQLDAARFTQDDCRHPRVSVVFPLRGATPRVTIPTLAAVFAAFSSAQRMTVELKSAEPSFAPRVVALLRAHGRVATTCVGSFNAVVTGQLRALLPDGCVWSSLAELLCAASASAERLVPEPCARVAVLQAPATYAGAPFATASFVARAHARGSIVQVWTVNDEPTMRRLLSYGVDGIFTDYPSRLRAVLANP